MKINPKITEQITEVSVKAKNAVKEEFSKSEVREEVAELPRMSLESVMPKSNIVRSTKQVAEEFDVKKAIDEIQNIIDVETIKKICAQWKKDIDTISEKFKSGKIPQEKVYEEHRNALESLSMYDIFAEKITNLASQDASLEESIRIFAKYIEPQILHSQGMMRIVDNLPSVRAAYQLATGHSPAAKVTMPNMLEEEMKSITDINEASILISKLEKERHNMSEAEFNKLNEVMESRLQDIIAGKVQIESKPNVVSKAILSPTSKPEINITTLSSDIEKLSSADLMTNKISQINDQLTVLASSDKKAYADLSEKFNSRLMELS